MALHSVASAADLGATAVYEDAAYYSKAYRNRRRDVEYYVALALRCKGPVLEYGVGNGRVALAAAQAGATVVGVDHSASMLDDFKTKLQQQPREVQRRVRLKKGDMRRTRLKQRFNLVIAPFNVVLHLYSQMDVEEFFARVREHLTPHGRLVFDFSLPRVAELTVDPKKTYGSPRFRHPTHGGIVKYKERFEYDSLRQILLCRMEFTPVDGSPAWEVPLTHRQFFPEEMRALLRHNGFTWQQWTADFSDHAPDADTDSIVISCATKPPRIHA
ncbi:MAG TPA: class I SAM-dependent methyltransferase [Polyangiaceae bacterium]|nr:class I SAM-dependent methyltransferase [Polyangiaceae bacterium]